jgi:nucleoid-associated protein YgaU
VPIEIPTISRLIDADLVIADNGTEDIEFWDLPMPKRFETAVDDTIYTVDNLDTIDTLAFRVYGDARPWDVIADANGFFILPLELKPGDQIRVPSLIRFLRQIRPGE